MPRQSLVVWVWLGLLSIAGCGTSAGQVAGDGGDAGGEDAPGIDDVAVADDAGSDLSAAVDAAVAPEVMESACVTAAALLPWVSRNLGGALSISLDVVASGGAVAVLGRTADHADLRTYDGQATFIAQRTLATGSQVLAGPGDGFTVIDRVGDAFVATTEALDLASPVPALSQPAAAGERAMAAVRIGAATALLTDQRFLDLGTGASTAWASALGETGAETFRTGRIYGMTVKDDKLLLAWGAHDVLGLLVVDAAGTVGAHVLDDKYLLYLGSQTATAIPHGGGLLLFDGNPVRLTQVDFALTYTPLGKNEQLRTFYRTAPRVEGLRWRDQPVAFWLTVFPGMDASQGVTPHQLYGCTLDPEAPASCVTTARIFDTGLTGYEIAAEPLAVAALPAGDAFAIVHSDAGGRTWLRIANMSCQRAGD